MSRTFPRIGKIRESTPFQRGMNSKAVLDSEIRRKKNASVFTTEFETTFLPTHTDKKKKK